VRAIIVFLLAALVAAFALLRGKKRKEAEPTADRPVITETGGITGAPHADQNPPTFSCCESNMQVDTPKKRDVNWDVKNSPPHWVLVVDIPINIKFECAMTPDSKCYGTFSSVGIRQDPKLGNAGPANAASTYWTAVRGDCDGSKYEGDIHLYYIAAYAKPAVDAAFNGTLELELRFPAGKGENKRLVINLKQGAGATPPGAPEADKLQVVKIPAATPD
jgi:hypothetical protein